MEPSTNAIFDRILQSFLRQKAMQTFGASLVNAEEQRVSIRLPFRDDLTQQAGYLHAGVIASIADSACGYAALTMLPEGKEVLTVEYKVNLLAPATGDSFRADATVLRSGRTLSVCRADIFAEHGDNEKLIAAMTATIFALDS